MGPKRNYSLKVKLKIFNAIVLLILLYGATAWALTKTEEIGLDAVGMGMLWSIVGVRPSEHLSSPFHVGDNR